MNDERLRVQWRHLINLIIKIEGNIRRHGVIEGPEYWILNGVFIKFAGLASDDIIEKFDLNKEITKLDHNGVLYDVIAGF